MPVAPKKASTVRGEVGYEYDELDQLRLEYENWGDVSQVDFEYFYDDNGNQRRKLNHDTGREWNYLYDSQNKLRFYYDGVVTQDNLYLLSKKRTTEIECMRGQKAEARSRKLGQSFRIRMNRASVEPMKGWFSSEQGRENIALACGGIGVCISEKYPQAAFSRR